MSVDIQALGASSHIFRVSWTTPGVSEPVSVAVSVRIGQTHGTVANNLESWMIWLSKYISCYENLFLGHLHARGYGGSSFRPVPSSACSVEQEDTALIRSHRGFYQLWQGRGARLWSSVPTRRMKVMWRIKQFGQELADTSIPTAPCWVVTQTAGTEHLARLQWYKVFGTFVRPFIRLPIAAAPCGAILHTVGLLSLASQIPSG